MHTVQRDDERRARERVIALLDSAFTRAEVEAAEAALDAHLAAFPEDRFRDLGHGFHYKVGAVEEREEASRALGLSEEQHQERERMLRSTWVVVNPVEEPDCLERLAGARREVERWLDRHPDDPHARSRREYLEQEVMPSQQILDLLREEPVLPAALAA